MRLETQIEHIRKALPARTRRLSGEQRVARDDMTPNAIKYLSTKTADLTPRLGKVRQYLGAVVTASGRM